MPRDSRSAAVHLSVAASMLALGACGASRVQTLDGRAAPATVSQDRMLDVQLFQGQQSVRFTNSTARPLGPGWLWINGWFSAEIPVIGVGERLEVPLRDFRNEFGEPPRAGGFWAGRDATRVVHAQIETTDAETGASSFLGLVVVGQGVR